MEIAALIIGILALLISIASLSWQLGKHWSSHVVQLQPVETMFGDVGKKIGEEFKEFDSRTDMMSDEEKKYFDRHNKG